MQSTTTVPVEIFSVAHGLRLGQHKIKCPLCQNTRRAHKNDKPLSVNVDPEGFRYYCHHCGAEGGRWNDEKPERLEPIVLPHNLDPIEQDLALAYLAKRGIDHKVMEDWVVTGKYQFNGKAEPAVGFKYTRDGNVRAIKWRSAGPSKQFSQENVCDDFFLLDTHVEGQPILICEGEVDALSWLTAGVEGVTVWSIPNGAPAKVKDGKIDPREDNKFKYVWRAEQQINSASRIYLNTDNDGPGRALAEELARRIGKAKAWTVDLGDHKDASEALNKEGPDFLRQALANATPMPMLGLHVGQDYDEDFAQLYDHGKPRGASTGLYSLDNLMSISPAMLTVVTGYPGSGKSDLVDQIAVNLAQSYGWRTVYCSFEKPVELHMAQLSEKLIGKPFFAGPNPRMTPEERDYCVDWITEHMAFIDYRKGGRADIDSILDKASAAVMRMGARMLVIDPYNYIEVDRFSKMETDIISDMLTKVKQWAKLHDAHVMFVAHPRLMQDPQIVPTGHHVAKSAAWFAKADTGLTVMRDPETRSQSAHIWKMKWSWMGSLGKVELGFDPVTGRWFSLGGGDDPFDWSF